MSKSTEINEHQLDRLDDRYVTIKEAIYGLAGLVAFLIPGVIWVIMSISELKNEIKVVNDKLIEQAEKQEKKSETDKQILENIINSKENIDKLLERVK